MTGCTPVRGHGYGVELSVGKASWKGPEGADTPVVVFRREGRRVLVRPAGPAEESRVSLRDDETMVFVMPMTHLVLEGRGSVRVVPEGRIGHVVYAREIVSGTDADHGQMVLMFEGDRLERIERIRAGGMSTEPEVGEMAGMIIRWPIGPAGYTDDETFIRTVPPGDVSGGNGVLAYPGRVIIYRAGDLALALGTVDANVRGEEVGGYAPVTSSLFTWMYLMAREDATLLSGDAFRLLLAAGRRLDASHRALRQVQLALEQYHSTEDGIRARQLMFEVIGAAEVAAIALNKTLQLPRIIKSRFALRVGLPEKAERKKEMVRKLRNPYEHLEKGALGLSKSGNPDPEALSAFDFEGLFQDSVLRHGGESIDLTTEAGELLTEVRTFLLEAGRELAEQGAGDP